MRLLPILFSQEMQQANLDGVKNMTRRLRGLDAVNERPDDWDYVRFWNGHAKFCEVHNYSNEKHIACPYGQQGDVLWVHENFAVEGDVTKFYTYTTDDDGLKIAVKWKPNIHMPYEACRMWLEVVDVRVERLHSISIADIKREGVRIPLTEEEVVQFEITKKHSALEILRSLHKKWDAAKMYRAFWAELWCTVNGRESWDKNPWVWVITFKQVNKPEGLQPKNRKAVRA